jgi:hypothetical protein
MDMPDLGDVLSAAPFDLDAALDAALDPDQTDQAEQTAAPFDVWRIDGDRTAEWVAAKLAAARGRQEERSAMAAEWRERIDRWQIDAGRRDAATIDWAVGELTRYMLDERRRDGRKTVVVPSAKIRSTARPSSVTVTDEAALLAWLDTHVEPALRDLVVRRTIRTGELRGLLHPVEVAAGWAVVDLDGQIPDGVTVAPPSVSVSISTAGTQR